MPGRLSRRRVADYIAESLIEGKDKTLLFKQLASFLVDTRRTKELDLIVRDIEFSLSKKGVVSASIVSAFELTTEIKNELEHFVKTKTGASQVSLSSSIDPSVLGGVKVTIPGSELDQTVSRQLTVLKTRFKKA